jgi:hypothetical protein
LGEDVPSKTAGKYGRAKGHKEKDLKIGKPSGLLTANAETSSKK